MKPLKSPERPAVFSAGLAWLVWALSPALFAAVEVSSPVAGQVLYMGSRCQIAWTSDLPSDMPVRIELHSAFDPWGPREVIGDSRNTGSFDWQVPEYVIPGDYYVALLDALDQPLANAGPVLIEPSPLIILSPFSDSVLAMGKRYAVTWQNYDPNNTPLRVFMTGGPDGSVLAYLGTTESSAGQVTIRVPRKIPEGFPYQVVLEAPNYAVASQGFLVVQRLPR